MSKKDNKRGANKGQERKAIFRSKQAKKNSGRKSRHWNKRVGKGFKDGILGEEHFDFFEDWYRHISILCYTTIVK